MDSGDISPVAGLYRPRAEFLDTDAVVSVDDAGRVFFQSPGTGCVGNGTVTPRHAQANVFDVRLTLASCTGKFAACNGALEGLATLETDNPWDYSAVYSLLLWVSSPSGAAAALRRARGGRSSEPANTAVKVAAPHDTACLAAVDRYNARS